jgi:putative tryptophan/tyrosine transport system substrate-binding protein
LAPFLQGLKEAGFVEGQNVMIEYRWAEGRLDRLPALAADLVNHRVAVIYATGGLPPAYAAKATTATIPIVFQGGGEDPVKIGLVASFNRPGGNVTGFVNLTGRAIETKIMQFLRELVPAAESLGLLVNLNNVDADSREALAAATALGWKLHILSASTADAFFTSRREQLVELAARYVIPAAYTLREFVVAGGLMSYGADLRDTNRQGGIYVGRILKGEKPADLPVQQPTRIELTLNLKTAKTLGIEVPATLVATADEVIQ